LKYVITLIHSDFVSRFSCYSAKLRKTFEIAKYSKKKQVFYGVTFRYSPLLQQSPVIIAFQYLHLLNGNMVEFNESLSLWHSVIDEYSIDILHI